MVAAVRDDSACFKYWMLSLMTALATGNAVVVAVEEQFVAEAEACRRSAAQAPASRLRCSKW